MITVDENQILQAPESGVYVKGTFLEGAGWDKKAACLIEPQPMQLVCAMPLIHFKPAEVVKKKVKGDEESLRFLLEYKRIHLFFRTVFVSVLLLSNQDWNS